MEDLGLDISMLSAWILLTNNDVGRQENRCWMGTIVIT